VAIVAACSALFRKVKKREEGELAEPTLESLAKRVDALERTIASLHDQPRKKDWRRVIGMFQDSEFMREVDEECLRSREREREAARRAEIVEIM